MVNVLMIVLSLSLVPSTVAATDTSATSDRMMKTLKDEVMKYGHGADVDGWTRASADLISCLKVLTDVRSDLSNSELRGITRPTARAIGRWMYHFPASVYLRPSNQEIIDRTVPILTGHLLSALRVSRQSEPRRRQMLRVISRQLWLATRFPCIPVEWNDRSVVCLSNKRLVRALVSHLRRTVKGSCESGLARSSPAA